MKYKIKSRKADPNDPMFTDSQSGVTAVTIPKSTPKPPPRATPRPVPKSKAAPTPQAEPEPPISLEEFQRLQKRKDEALEIYERFSEKVRLYKYSLIEDFWLAIINVRDIERQDKILEEIEWAGERLIDRR